MDLINAMPLNRSGNKRGMNLNSHKNLLGFQHIGNPKNDAAKKALSITRKQREMLLEPCPYKKGVTWLEWLAERGLALAGENATYYKELLDRLEGKVLQQQEISSLDVGITVVVSGEQARDMVERVIKGERTQELTDAVTDDQSI